MKGLLKRYAPTLFTLLLIAAGAAMPWLSAVVQDARIGTMQEDLDLNTVSLTLLQNNGVEQALRIVSSIYVEVPWEGETKLAEQDAVQAALEALRIMDDDFGLLPAGDVDILEKLGGSAQPILVLAEDGSSGLLWNCYWDTGDKIYYYSVAVDDATGKAVRMIAANSAWIDGNNPEDIFVLLDGWLTFLQGYYDLELASVGELESGGDEYRFALNFSAADDSDSINLRLGMYYDNVIFNY